MSSEKRFESETKSVKTVIKKSNIIPNNLIVIVDSEDAVKSLSAETSKSKRRLVISFKKGYFAKTDNIYRPRGTMLQCLQCSESFPTKLSLITHSKMHLKPFCVACHVYEESQHLMGVHMKEAHPTLTKFYVKQDPTLEDEVQAEFGDKVLGELSCNRMEFAGLANVNNMKEAAPSFCPAKLVSRFGRSITTRTLDY